MSRKYLREVFALMLVSLASGAPQHSQVLQQSSPVQMSPAHAAHFMQQQNALNAARNLVDPRNQLPLAIRLTNGIGDALQATELQLGGYSLPWRNFNAQASPARSPQNGQAILPQFAPPQPFLAAPFQVPALLPIQSAPTQVPTDVLSRAPQVPAPAPQAVSALAPQPAPIQMSTFTPAPAPQNTLVRPIPPVKVPAYAIFPSAPTPMQFHTNTVANNMPEPLFMALNQAQMMTTRGTPSANSPFFVVMPPVNSPESSPQVSLPPTNNQLPSPQAMFVQVPSGEASTAASLSPQNAAVSLSPQSAAASLSPQNAAASLSPQSAAASLSPQNTAASLPPQNAATNTLGNTSPSNTDLPFIVIVPTGSSPMEAPIMMTL